MIMTIEELKKSGWIAYEYIRGSHAYGLNTETSDIDKGGVYICPPEMLMGLRSNYIEQISDEKNDTVYYEFGRWIELLLKSNPTALESLFIPKHCIIGEVHPMVQYIIDNRDMFLTKECLKPLISYSKSQIYKCRGLNKKIVNPIHKRKDLLDFCYTFKGQGSYPMKKFLEDNKLDQKYCGLVNIPNMQDVYGVYYDFAAYLKFEPIDDKTKRWIVFESGLVDANDVDTIFDRMDNKEFYGYSGIMHPDGTSNTVRLSSIPKNEKPICMMSYNQNGYETHCRKYKEYKDWEKHRNPVRYESNLTSNYDCKNVMHCTRLLHMGKELVEGKGFNVERTWDKNILIDIRNHKYEYEEIIGYVENLYQDIVDKMGNCFLPDAVDENIINQMLIKARKGVIF